MSKTTLVVNNCYSQIFTDDKELRQNLWSLLRFKERGYFHSSLYKQKKWDGYVDFFSLATGKFLTGLLPEVGLVLQTFNVDPIIVDHRVAVPWIHESIDVNFLRQFQKKKDKPFVLYDYQAELTNQALKYSRCVLQAPTGCHAAGEMLLKYDGHLQSVENLVVGDRLMGPDSRPRTISELISGDDELFEICIGKKDKMMVNGDHVLTLIKTTSHKNRYASEKGGLIVDVTVREWLKWSNWKKHIYKMFRTPVKFEPTKCLPLSPYFLGIMLGDGGFTQSVRVTTTDNEIIAELEHQAKLFNIRVVPDVQEGKCPTYYLSGTKKVQNPIASLLQNIGLWGLSCGDKFIPHNYKTASITERLELLAGLIDTDGHSASGKRNHEITSKSRKLAEDIQFVARSLGFYASLSPTIKSSQNGTSDTYYRVLISANASSPNVPCRIAKKRMLPGSPYKNNLRSGFTIKPLRYGKYYGFRLNEEPHYLTSDFIVTHNSGKTEIMVSILKCLPPNTPTLVLANRKSLVAQNYDALMKWGFKNVGRLYEKYVDPNFITCATVQSLHKIEKLLPEIRALVVDEIHDMMTPTTKKYYKKMDKAYVRVAVSATPFKYGGSHDTQKYAVKGYFGPLMLIECAGSDGLLTTAELQDRGNLSKSRCVFYPINEPQLPFEIYLDAVTYGIARNYYLHEITTRLAKSLTGRTLILVERIEHGDMLANMLPGCLWVKGKDNTDTRMYVIKELQKSKDNIVAIATSGIFNTGINVKIHNLINAAGGTAEHVIEQRMGRGLRTADDKDILNYYDFMFHINDYLDDHSRKRVRVLTSKGHEVIVKDKIDF